MKKKLVALCLILLLLLVLTASRKPQVWKFDCTGCADCQKICPTGAITIIGNKAEIDPQKCIDCKLCLKACTYDAIK